MKERDGPNPTSELIFIDTAARISEISEMRVIALSDVHTDHPDNLRWIEELSSSDYTEDLLILAGDVAERAGDQPAPHGGGRPAHLLGQHHICACKDLLYRAPTIEMAIDKMRS